MLFVILREPVHHVLGPGDYHVLAAWALWLLRQGEDRPPDDVVQQKGVDDEELANVVVWVNEGLEGFGAQVAGYHEEGDEFLPSCVWSAVVPTRPLLCLPSSEDVGSQDMALSMDSQYIFSHSVRQRGSRAKADALNPSMIFISLG